MITIYHITDKKAWELALTKGWYETRSLESEGFIHCSLKEQVNDSANRHYKGRLDLLILQIDETKVRSRVVHDLSKHHNLPFPHIYGPLNTDAVVGWTNINPDHDGTFNIQI